MNVPRGKILRSALNDTNGIVILQSSRVVPRYTRSVTLSPSTRLRVDNAKDLLG